MSTKIFVLIKISDLMCLKRTAKLFSDISVIPLATPGQKYIGHSGQPAYVPAGKVLVQIERTSSGGLELFWAVAEEKGFRLFNDEDKDE